MSEGDFAPEIGGGKEQDRFLPIANIGRIMRRAVPENGKIAKDAKESLQECVSEFISFITSEASDKCMKEKRKTINGDDLIWSMGTLGFEDYVEPLKLYLKLYREVSLSNLPILSLGLFTLVVFVVTRFLACLRYACALLRHAQCGSLGGPTWTWC
ncbi:nuclear transcription factor Y subunit B-4-like [Phragmites australis]|uniref:nuclear transcription factor Y subunit B-4-like n=1 Tax=Phragmites australis TaxID=29695 RepID=UPI002D78A662|nr:nuclear transcription factor Y subunit B-4-like [Phragmites australis]